MTQMPEPMKKSSSTSVSSRLSPHGQQLNTKIPSTFYFLTSTFLLLIFLLSSLSLNSQTLYQDALRLSKAIQASQLTMQVQADTTVAVNGLSPGKSPINFELRSNAIRGFRENMVYTLTSLANDTFELTLYNQMDTLRISAIPGRIRLDNKAGSVSINYGDTTFNWIKKDYISIYSVLGGYEFSTAIDPKRKEGSYDFIEFITNYQDNPYLSSIVNRLALQEGDALQLSGPVLDSVLAGVKSIRKNEFSTAQENLLEGKRTTTDYLISIRDVQLKYQKPPVSSFNTLTNISNRIKASQAASGQADFTSVLIAGLSDFIVERAQEEFNVAFMNRLKERLDSVPELRVLFPRSQLFFDQIDITNYKSLLSSAREAFISDINNISINFPLLFNLEKYRALNNIPAVYNLISLYKVVDLVYHGVPIDTLLPLAFHELRGRQLELDKEINLDIAQTKIGDIALKNLAARVGNLEDSLVAMRKLLNRKQADFYQQMPIAMVQASIAKPALIPQLDQLNEQALPGLSEPYEALKNAWDTTRLIPSYLRGQYNYEYLLENPRIEQFDKYFEHAPDSVELVGAGLELTRYLVDGVDGGDNKAEILQKWANRVNLYHAQLNEIIAAINQQDSLTILQTRLDSLNTARINLRQEILADIPFWKNEEATLQDTMALKFLAGTLRTFFYADQKAVNLVDTVQMRGQFLMEVTTKLKGELDSLQVRLKPDTKSPLQQKFNIQDSLNNVVQSLSKSQQSIQWLLQESNAISQTLDSLRQDCCRELVDARKNATIVGEAVELSSFMLNSFLVDQPNNKWMTLNQFNQLTSDQVSRDVFLGLIFQQLKSVPIARNISSEGVAALASDFVSTLSEVNIQMDTIAYRKRNNQRITFKDYLPFVAASVQVMNQILETPFLLETNASGNRKPLSLIQQRPVLEDIPEVSRTILSLFENASNQNYRYAVSNVVSLVETLTANLDQDCSQNNKLTQKEKQACKRKNKTRLYLTTYGNFIADVAMAHSAEEVKTALSNVALPPGSSWTKREDPFNVSLNAYFGAAVGRENLSNENPGQIWPFNSFSLTVPVGVSFSAKIPRNMKGSWTLFFPILDLGAISAYRINEPENRLPVLSFQNIIAPGIHLFYNFPKSPFYFGTGWQYGPAARKVTENGVDIQKSASRFLLTFGVDVPIFNLYKVNQN